MKSKAKKIVLSLFLFLVLALPLINITFMNGHSFSDIVKTCDLPEKENF